MLDSGEGDRAFLLNSCAGNPLDKGVGEGSIEGQNLNLAWENGLKGDGIENGMPSSCGDENHPSTDVVTYPGEEVKGSEPLIVHPLVMVEAQGMPYSVSSNWAAERVKKFYHVVGLSCKGFEDQLLALFPAIEASTYRNSSTSSPDLSFKSNRGNRELKTLVCSVNYDNKGGHS